MSSDSPNFPGSEQRKYQLLHDREIYKNFHGSRANKCLEIRADDRAAAVHRFLASNCHHLPSRNRTVATPPFRRHSVRHTILRPFRARQRNGCGCWSARVQSVSGIGLELNLSSRLCAEARTHLRRFSTESSVAFRKEERHAFALFYKLPRCEIVGGLAPNEPVR